MSRREPINRQAVSALVKTISPPGSVLVFDMTASVSRPWQAINR